MALSSRTTIPEISALLREMGEAELAERLEYLSSEADLDPGESAATDASARGFFEFFNAVQSEGKVVLGCSPEGVICAEWRFQDQRSVAIWFLDANRARFSAITKDGRFVDVKQRNKIANRSEIATALVGVGQELFAWRPS